MDPAGHHAITSAAVHELFDSDPDGKIMGHSRSEFYDLLDKAQAYQDRWYGPTSHPSVVSPDAQREHSMADPSKSGAQNLRDSVYFIGGELYVAKVAHDAGNSELEMKSLGAAVHALEDSFSSAHVFRNASDASNPHASVEAFNNFYITGEHNTHEYAFDKVPIAGDRIERATDQAAVAAVVELIRGYLSNIDASKSEAYSAYTHLAATFYMNDGHVAVLDNTSLPQYTYERMTHYANEVCGLNGAHSVPQNDVHVSSNSDGATFTPANANMSSPVGHAVHVSPNSDGAAVTPADANISSPGGHAVHVSPNSDGAALTPADANISSPSGHALHVSPNSDGATLTPADANMSSPDGHAVHVSPNSDGATLTQVNANMALPDGHATHSPPSNDSSNTAAHHNEATVGYSDDSDHL